MPSMSSFTAESIDIYQPIRAGSPLKLDYRGEIKSDFGVGGHTVVIDMC